MKAYRARFAYALAALLSSALACKALSPSAPSAASTPGTHTGAGATLFTDDFSSSHSGWQTESTTDDVIDYANDGLRIKVWSPQSMIFSPLENRTFQDIHIEATVKDPGGDNPRAYGFLCDLKGPDQAFYYAALDPSGSYKLGKYLAADDKETLLTGNKNDWTSTDATRKNAASYRLGMDCAHGAVAFYVDGKQIAAATDSSLTQGSVALLLWSGDSSTEPVTFDDVAISSLK